MKPGSQNARLLAVLQDHEWHVSRELHERCGYNIEGESVPGRTGTDGYRYRLPASSESEPESGWGASSSTREPLPKIGAEPMLVGHAAPATGGNSYVRPGARQGDAPSAPQPRRSPRGPQPLPTAGAQLALEMAA